MASISRWDPLQEMVTLREAMNQLLEESVVRNQPKQGLVPALDLAETPDAYELEMAVPGLKSDDLDITFENNVLAISGEIKQNEERSERNYHRVERRYGRFQRAVTLPNLVKADAISANLEHGVLMISVPKAEEIKPRSITVRVNS